MQSFPFLPVCSSFGLRYFCLICFGCFICRQVRIMIIFKLWIMLIVIVPVWIFVMGEMTLSPMTNNKISKIISGKNDNRDILTAFKGIFKSSFCWSDSPWSAAWRLFWWLVGPIWFGFLAKVLSLTYVYVSLSQTCAIRVEDIFVAKTQNTNSLLGKNLSISLPYVQS